MRRARRFLCEVGAAMPLSIRPAKTTTSSWQAFGLRVALPVGFGGTGSMPTWRPSAYGGERLTKAFGLRRRAAYDGVRLTTYDGERLTSAFGLRWLGARLHQAHECCDDPIE